MGGPPPPGPPGGIPPPAAAGAAAAAKPAGGASGSAAAGDKEVKGRVREAAGTKWFDPTLGEWPENDYRVSHAAIWGDGPASWAGGGAVVVSGGWCGPWVGSWCVAADGCCRRGLGAAVVSGRGGCAACAAPLGR